MNEYVNQAMAMFQKMIAAATPVAQKAWEISLLTLQIDALAAIIPTIVAIFAMSGVLFCLHRAYKKACVKAESGQYKTSYGRICEPHDLLFAEGIPHIFLSMGCVVGLTCAMGFLLDVWLWVKLLKPELWLAHEAIQAVVSKLVK